MADITAVSHIEIGAKKKLSGEEDLQTAAVRQCSCKAKPP
jgi:hypothetical protein